MDLIEVTELHKKLRECSEVNNVVSVTTAQASADNQCSGHYIPPKTTAVLDYITLLMKPEEMGHG